MEFFKYQGTGNDFVMIDNRRKQFDDTQANIGHICHRRFGVGADGLILIENAEGYDFRMRYFNADGAEGSMCGNGGRCAVQFASDLGIFQDTTRFLAVDGEHRSRIAEGSVFLHMIDVEGIEEEADGYFVNTGSPHLVIFSDNVDALDVKTLGSGIRYSPYWKSRGGVNVNFVQVVSADTLKVRTYERGVEDETYSCGTGVTAAAIVSHLRRAAAPDLLIQTLGGTLKVSLNSGNRITGIILSGPAKRVFRGDL
ncbi:MAG: diaminopimelate epimerase [Leadbetterella sp.]|nr:diaminopimelate epimerase [Leadbetterella sp.]